jgi:hypothetical protein
LNEEKQSTIQVGGSIEKATKGDYAIDIKAVLQEAWSITLASRKVINISLFFTFALGLIVTFIVSSYFGGIETVFNDQKLASLLNILVTLVVYPFLAGVEMIAIFHAVGLKTHQRLVFAFLKRGSWVAVCALLSSMLVTIGLELLYLPGIFLAVALTLVLPLVVEKRLSPLKAIILSIQSTRHQWFQIFALYLVSLAALVLLLLPLITLAQTAINVVGVVFFFIGLSYLAPFFYHVKGILYREIFGMQLSINTQSSNEDSNTTFAA